MLSDIAAESRQLLRGAIVEGLPVIRPESLFVLVAIHMSGYHVNLKLRRSSSFTPALRGSLRFPLQEASY